MIDLKVRVLGITFRNPILIASGPGGFGEELSKHLDFSKIGGFITKTITPNPREGNAPPRIVDTHGGILNSIGLPNPGIEKFTEETIPQLKKLNTNIFVSIGGDSLEDFEVMAQVIDGFQFIKGIELNLSCPNVSKGGLLFGKDSKILKKIVSLVTNATNKPVLAKLTPEVTDITEFAQIAIEGGADGISLINCPQGLRININTGLPYLKRGIGGLSGPAIKPIALAKIYQVRSKLPDIPIIGVGGVMTYEDVLEFAMAGANLVAIGTGIMINPKLPEEILPKLIEFLESKRIRKYEEIVGISHKEGLK